MRPFAQRIEVGPWLDVGLRLEGEAVHRRLVAAREPPPSPYCIYIHVPFCPSRCSYCALYTREVKKNPDRVFDEYLEQIKQAIITHPWADRRQVPTTVHFGGGTPLSIGLKRFGALALALRKAFGDSSQCEWAVETTTSSINDDSLAALKELRFRRIHLGIQTLDNEIRCRIRRRESGERGIEKIHLLNANDFLPSVDLILGFDGSTEAILLRDLNRLYDAGIRIFSICDLRSAPETNGNTRQRQEEIERNHAGWQMIWEFMEDHELIPIHLGQFGRSYQDNLYYTHPARGEDCLAIGPYAHGTAGRLYYANRLLPHYYRALLENKSPIDFGMLYDDEIQTVRKLERQLLAHGVMPATVAEVRAAHHREFGRLWETWLEHALVVEDPGRESFSLSQDGSWFVGNMILQARELVKARQPKALKKAEPASPPAAVDENCSRGCQSCQEGKWLCIYLTYLCNARCAFCPAPFKQEDRIISAFGDDSAVILMHLRDHPFNGISFSGGDCFLVFDRLLAWLTYFKQQRPEIYYWAYTNGLAVDESKLRQLAAAGLDELRFNIAATDYDSPVILDKIAVATRLLKSVAVEIPSIPRDYQKLAEVLPELDRLHVKYLNLHEYILVPEDPGAQSATAGNFLLNKVARLQYDVDSLENTDRIKRFCQTRGLKITINNCSLLKKENQMLQRRRAMGSLLKEQYEQLTPDGLLQTCLVCPNEPSSGELQHLVNNLHAISPQQGRFVHPEACEEAAGESASTIARLSFLPPLDVHGQRVLIQTEILNRAER